jgi:hypothetical protein
MIRRLKRLTIILLLTWVAVGVIAHAQTPAPASDDAVYGLVTDYEIDVRVGPDFAYPIVDRLPRDGSVEVLGRAGAYYYGWDGRQWLQVQYGSSVGWVMGRTIRLGRAFNSLPITALILPRDRNGRVPEVFDLSTNICDRWQGAFTFSGNFMTGDQQAVVTFPELVGTYVYSVVTIAPSGLRRSFDTDDTTYTIELGRLNREPGVYQWGVIPYWNDTPNPQRAQQLCLLRIGGTFEKPDTTPPEEQSN